MGNQNWSGQGQPKSRAGPEHKLDNKQRTFQVANGWREYFNSKTNLLNREPKAQNPRILKLKN